MEYDSGTERLGGNERLCTLVQDLLPLYLDDEVSISSRALIVAHLNECAHCAGFLAGARSVREQLRRERGRVTGGPVSILLQLVQAFTLVAAALGIAAVVAILGLVTTALLQRQTTLIDLFSSLSPRAMYAIAGLATLGATSWLMLRSAQHVKPTRLVASLTALGLGMIGFAMQWPNDLVMLLRVMLLAVGLASLWQWRHVLRDLVQRDFLKIVGLTLLVLGVMGVGAVLSSVRLFPSSLVEAVPSHTESVAYPTSVAVPSESQYRSDSRVIVNVNDVEPLSPTPVSVPYTMTYDGNGNTVIQFHPTPTTVLPQP